MAAHPQMRSYMYFHHHKILNISASTGCTHVGAVSPYYHCKTLFNKPLIMRFHPQLSIWQITTALPLQHVMLPQPDVAQLSFFVDSLAHVSQLCVQNI